MTTGDARKASLRAMTALIGKGVTVRVDRPLGSRHPDFPDLCYAVNYGFLPGTQAPDDDAIDAYIVGIEEPLESFEGRCIAVIHRLDDMEDKLVIAPFDAIVSPGAIQAATHFQERHFRTKLIMDAAAL